MTYAVIAKYGLIVMEDILNYVQCGLISAINTIFVNLSVYVCTLRRRDTSFKHISFKYPVQGSRRLPFSWRLFVATVP